MMTQMTNPQIFCAANVWTIIWEGPTFGSIFLDADEDTGATWERVASTAPWAHQANLQLWRLKNVTMWHGLPAGFCIISIRPARNVRIAVS